MGPYALLYLYRNRLRVHAAQELLAGLGVTVAVALVFATLVANGSIAGSASQVVHTVIGPANLQIRTTAPDGFDEGLLGRVEHLAGVKQAAPLLEQTATIAGAQGRHTVVNLAGTDISLATLDGLAHTLPAAALSPHGIGLSKTTAAALGLPPSAQHAAGEPISLQLRGQRIALQVSTVLGAEAFGALSQAHVAVMALAEMQTLAGLPGRISRILIQTDPGQAATVRNELHALTRNRIAVTAADQDLALLRQALRPSGQASALFAAISALLGFLLAFNAMLLTVPERRQAIADLRIDGTTRTAIIQMVLFQALCLGAVASFAGLVIGDVLSRGVFHQTPGYLAQAFTLGTSTVVGLKPVLLALAGGILATCLASVLPLLDLRRRYALDAIYSEDGIPGNALSRTTQQHLALAAIALLALASALFALVTSAAIAACVLLALATVLVVPLMLAGVLNTADALTQRYRRLTSLPVALTSLKATTLRSLALVATGAIAIFGSVALGGAREDLLRGLDRFATTYSADAALWVLNPQDTAGANNFDVSPHDIARIARIPGVASVEAFQSEFMDIGLRRAWVIARPPGAPSRLLYSQITSGNPSSTVARLRVGGWVAVSQPIATEQHAHIGGLLRLPTPSGTATFRLAAITTNFGWTAGAIVMSTSDYTHFWATSAPTALGIDLAPNARPPAVREAISTILGPRSSLEILTARSRASRFEAIAGEGLSQLGDISTLLIVAAILAMAAALGSSIWQRRQGLAELRLEGTRPARLRRILLLEATLMLSAGCLAGALAGVYGQAVIDSYLKHVTGFPVASFATSIHPLEIFLLVLAAVLAAAAIPGWLASRVSPALAFDD
jgi:putative ABC transport system permease protein